MHLHSFLFNFWVVFARLNVSSEFLSREPNELLQNSVSEEKGNLRRATGDQSLDGPLVPCMAQLVNKSQNSPLVEQTHLFKQTADGDVITVVIADKGRHKCKQSP